MGIGEAIALPLAKEGVNLALLSRSKDKLDAVRETIIKLHPGVNVNVYPVDIQDYTLVEKMVESVVSEVGEIDILINNAGLAFGAPARFWELPVELICQMNGTNISGLMYTTYFVLNKSMWLRKRGSIINISSVTGLECPPFNDESVYHANKAYLEVFSNSLWMETAISNTRVMVLRPGCVAPHFHLQRVKFDQDAMDEFFYGYEPLVADDLADTALFMLMRA
ncbi:NAD(P)-binding protein [Aspergillus heterothallicus]